MSKIIVEEIKRNALIVAVLFVGPDYTERKKEAFQLLEEGYAARILIPARSQYPDYYENTPVEALKQKKRAVVT